MAYSPRFSCTIFCIATLGKKGLYMFYCICLTEEPVEKLKG